MSTDLNNQYAPPKSTVADVGGADEEANLASRWSRQGGKPRRCIHDYIADSIVIGA